MTFSKPSRFVLFFVLGLTIISFFLTGCSIVGPGERGVRISFGSAADDSLAPGIYPWFPVVYGMTTLDTRVQKSETETSAASKDMQEITTRVAINWSLDPNEVAKVYKTVGAEDAVLTNVISPAVSEVLKAVTATKAAEEILTHRIELKTEIDTMLKGRLAKYGVSVNDVSIVNLSFSRDFTHAIELKQIAEQQAKQASYLAQKATQDARAAVETAKGQAEAQRLLKSTITTELLQKAAIEKWNGEFPQVMGGSGALPFINLKMGNGSGN